MSKPQATPRKDRSKLSERQRRILEFIDLFVQEHGYPPTIREIGNAVDIGSTSVVNYNLNKLVREGYLERSQKVSRGLQLVRPENEKNRLQKVSPASTARVRLAGQIVASRPVEFFDIHEDEVEVPLALIGKNMPEQVFALRVSGNSMMDAMVKDGDVVIVRHQQVAENGDMVAVWLRDSNETTLKYFYLEGGRVRLQPANPEMDAIYVDAAQVEIQGRVLAVMRVL
jgi:repressor LexA